MRGNPEIRVRHRKAMASGGTVDASQNLNIEVNYVKKLEEGIHEISTTCATGYLSSHVMMYGPKTRNWGLC